ncbi:MAG: DUF3341 domain-containing protein [Pseudobdellovibrionaceae bacterium]
MTAQFEIPEVYGVLAEYKEVHELISATQIVLDHGYKKIQTFTPHPVKELSELLNHDTRLIAFLTLVMGIGSCLGGYYLQYWISAISFPVNIGGRPYHSAPAFIPATFEITILGAAVTVFFSFLILCGLPRLNHPLFNVHQFSRASIDRYFLFVHANDPLFEISSTTQILNQSSALGVYNVKR